MIENDGIADIKIAVYLFHPKLSYIPKKYDKELKRYYSKNQWVKKLIDLAKEKESDLTNDEFLLSLRSLNFSDLITDKIYNEYCNINKLTDSSIDKLKTQLKTVIVNEQIKVAEDEQVDPVAYVEAIQSINLDAMSDMASSHSDTISESSFLNISCADINESFKEVVKSSWDPLNRANAFGGLINNQLILVCAPPGCFHGDTEVMTLDGKTRTIKSLAEETDSDYKYVYSMNSNLRPVVSKANKCQITKYVDHWTVLDIDGTIIKCTDDHQFMLIDGTYVEAKYLKPGDSLRSITRRHYSRKSSNKSINDYEYCSTEGLTRSNCPYTHELVKNYLISTGHWVTRDSMKYNVHHNSLIGNRFDRSNNLPSKLQLLTEQDHIKLHAKFDWTNRYDEKYTQLIRAGQNTRLTSEFVTNKNLNSWKNTEYRNKMAEVTSRTGHKLAVSRNTRISGYNGATLQRLMSTKKYVKSLIDRELINSHVDLTRELYTKNRNNPRIPSWESAMRYFSNNIEKLFNESVTYQNHTVRSVSVEYCKTPEPAYDLVNVNLYNNFAIACGDEGSGVIVHNCGKSLFCMQEVIEHLKAGRRCVYAAIGDLTEADFLVRLTAQILNIPLNNVSLDLEANRAKAIKLVPELKNLKLLFISPCEITAGDLYDYLKAKGYLDIDPNCPNGTTYFIDYDSNFAGAEDNLYKKGDEIYAKLVKLSRLPKSIVYVASQPKISAYEQLMIGEKDIGESSRKVHAVDVIVTIGKEPWSTNPIGWICIAKNRRGYPLNAMYFRDIDGRFKEINKNDYQVLKDSPERMTIDCTDAFEAIYFSPSIKDTNLVQ